MTTPTPTLAGSHVRGELNSPACPTTSHAVSANEVTRVRLAARARPLLARRLRHRWHAGHADADGDGMMHKFRYRHQHRHSPSILNASRLYQAKVDGKSRTRHEHDQRAFMARSCYDATAQGRTASLQVDQCRHDTDTTLQHQTVSAWKFVGIRSRPVPRRAHVRMASHHEIETPPSVITRPRLDVAGHIPPSRLVGPKVISASRPLVTFANSSKELPSRLETRRFHTGSSRLSLGRPTASPSQVHDQSVLRTGEALCSDVTSMRADPKIIPDDMGFWPNAMPAAETFPIWWPLSDPNSTLR